MVYDFGSLTENNYTGISDSTRSISSSEAEFEIEDRPALLQKKKRFDGMSTSLRGRARSTNRDDMSLSLRDRPRSTSATRRISAVIAKRADKGKKDATVVDVGVELLDDDDEVVDLHKTGSNFENAQAKNKTTAELEDIRKGCMKHQSSVQRNTENQSTNTERPQVLRAPSFSTLETPLEGLPSSGSEKAISKAGKEATPTPSTWIWSQRSGRQSNTCNIPLSPSIRTSPPRSPRRLRTKNTGLAHSNITPLDIANDSNTPVSPSSAIPRSSSPIKAFSQRAMGSILRNRKKTADDSSDPKLEVANDLNTITTNSNHAPPISPTKRAIAGILRACSLHDRSSLVKAASTHERTKVFSVHMNQNSRSNSGDQVGKKYDKENNFEKHNLGELIQGETAMPSNSERGTRSSIRLIANDNEPSYSRAVKSLVSPRQPAKRRLRASSIRESEKVVKNRDARVRRRSENGAARSSSRIRSSHTGGTLSSSPQKQTRRLSNGNSVSSKCDESSQYAKVTTGDQARSQSRTRRLSSRGSSREATDVKSPSNQVLNDEKPTIHLQRETVTRRSSSRRNVSSASTEPPRTPKTPRASRAGEMDARRSSSRSSSRRNVLEIQIPFSDDPQSPQPSKLGIQADGSKSVAHTSSRRGESATVDDSKTPKLSKSSGNESVKRSVSRRRVSDVQVPSIEEPKTLLSNRVSNHTRKSLRSRSVCPASSSDRIKHISRASSTRILDASEINDRTTEKEKLLPSHPASVHSNERRSSSRMQNRMGCNDATTRSRSRGRVPVDEEANSPKSCVVEPRVSSRRSSKTTGSESETNKKKRAESIDKVRNKQDLDHTEGANVCLVEEDDLQLHPRIKISKNKVKEASSYVP